VPRHIPPPLTWCSSRALHETAPKQLLNNTRMPLRTQEPANQLHLRTTIDLQALARDPPPALSSSQKHTSPSACKQNPVYPQFVQLAQSFRYCFAQYRSARSSSTTSYSYKSVFQSIFLILSRSFASLFSSCIKGVFVRISSS